MNKIRLDFGGLTLDAELFDTTIARKFFDCLPLTVNLTTWGAEAYGSIGADLGEENPVPEIPAGGLAYTRNGTYFCLFYGQTPAWAVEYIGKIRGQDWQKLTNFVPKKVVISQYA